MEHEENIYLGEYSKMVGTLILVIIDLKTLTHRYMRNMPTPTDREDTMTLLFLHWTQILDMNL